MQQTKARVEYVTYLGAFEKNVRYVNHSTWSRSSATKKRKSDANELVPNYPFAPTFVLLGPSFFRRTKMTTRERDARKLSAEEENARS